MSLTATSNNWTVPVTKHYFSTIITSNYTYQNVDNEKKENNGNQVKGEKSQNLVKK